MQRVALITLLVIAPSACGNAAQPADHQNRVHIVVLGSSTAAGYGLRDPQTSWPRRYAAFLATRGWKLSNLAVSGYSTYQIQPTGTANSPERPEVDRDHNITAALALQPDAIIVNLPSNDAAMTVPVADSLANIKVVATKARDAHVLFWVTTSQPRSLPPEQVRLIVDYRDRIKQDYGTYALDFFTPLAALDATPLPELNQGDGIHPNAEGHRLLFEQVRVADLPSAIAAAGSR
jgi:lysophospholipase L1-like esterase